MPSAPERGGGLREKGGERERVCLYQYIWGGLNLPTVEKLNPCDFYEKLLTGSVVKSVCVRGWVK